MMSEPIVTIVGRPNVGKSTFFNRIIGRRQAIVDNLPGVTRDRNYAVAEWSGQNFFLVDTGGYLPKSQKVIDIAVKEQVEIAISESDAIIFLVDIKTGITSTDEDLANLLLPRQKDVLLVVNKVDEFKDEAEVGQFYKLGLGEPLPVSAMVGRKTGDLLDILNSKLAKYRVIEEKDAAIKVAIIGKENVGKSSFINTLLNQERQIVTEIPGTTRDSIDTRFRFKNFEYVIIDTAGLKKRTKIKENILFYSNIRTYRSIRRCDVVTYIIDVNSGLTRQDVQALLDSTKERKGVVCVFNKWDLLEKDHKTMDNLRKEVKDRLGELNYIPVLFTSVIKKQRLFQTLEMVTKIFIERGKRIKTSDLNAYFEPIFKATTPPAVKGKDIRINYITQIKSNPQLFVLYCNYPELIAEHYKRFIENKMRKKFGFSGVPITLSFRKK